MALACHKSHHVGQGVVTVYSTPITSIRYVGEEDTYDIEMQDPYHNFVANGVVVHNSQRSQRYVNEQEFQVILPPRIAENSEAAEIFFSVIETIQDGYKKLKELGIPGEDARFILPNATETKMVFGADFREWRHILKLRTSKKAQWEIRGIANSILKILVKEAPNVFEDLLPKADGFSI